MLNVDNQKTISLLAKRSFSSKKKRNLIAIIAIALTAILFTTLFTVGMGITKAFEQETVRKVGTSAHAVLKDTNWDTYHAVKNHPLIKEIGAGIPVGIPNDPKLKKAITEMWYQNETDLAFSGIHLVEGRFPEAADEIVAGTRLLDILALPHAVGEQFSLSYDIAEKEYTKKFTIVGYYETDAVQQWNLLYVSKTLAEQHLSDYERLLQEGDETPIGKVTIELMFYNSRDVWGKLRRVLSDTGFSENPEAENYINSNVNWAYLSSESSPELSNILAVMTLLLLIITSGYLIIYSIFHISIAQEIHFYGQLKTIGTTKRQIKRIVRRQGLYLSLYGIPLGVIGGLIIGNLLLPQVLSGVTSLWTSEGFFTVHPLIIVFSVVFSLVTVFFSVSRPAKKAASVSPVEALHYHGESQEKVKLKPRKARPFSISRMAYSNMLRDKRKTLAIVLSLTLAIVTFASIFSIISSFSLESYVEQFSVADFIIADSTYFHFDYLGEETEAPENELIECLENTEGFEGGGKVFYESGLSSAAGGGSEFAHNIFVFSSKNAPKIEDTGYLWDYSMAQVIGMDPYLISKLDILKGSLNSEKLAKGGYIIPLAMNTTSGEDSIFSVGEIITLYLRDPEDFGNESHQLVSYDFEVMALAESNHLLGPRFYVGNQFAIIPQDFHTMIPTESLMLYAADFSNDKEPMVDATIKDYIETVSPNLQYESKEVMREEFESMISTLRLIGFTLSFLVGLIALLNFLNTQVTNILARKSEFITLRRVGMTKSQLQHMLSLEGLYFAFFTFISSLIISVLLQLFVFPSVLASFNMSSHWENLWPPLIITSLIFAAVAWWIPKVAYREKKAV